MWLPCGRLALGAAAVAALAPAVATAAPPGVINRLAQPTHVHDIAAGPRGELWFATSRSTVGWIGPQGTVHRFDLPKGETAVSIISARRGGAAWFSWNRLVRVKGNPVIGGIARVTSVGHIVHFRGPGDPLFFPHELVLGSGGDLWFDRIDVSYAGENVIGRMTPGGRFATFGADPSEDSFVTDVISGADGNVWFGNAEQGTVNRITPAGEITRFEAGVAMLQPHLYRLAAASDGSVYFSLQGTGRYGIGRVRPGTDTVSRFTRGLGPRVNGIGPLAVAPRGDVWFGVERKGPIGTTASPDGRAALGRLTPAGKITEFSRCLRPAAGPTDLTVGPDHDVWFLAGYSASNAYLTPGVGRITPAGQITEFRDGLGRSDDLEDLTSGAGRLWFIDRHGGTIGELRPPRGKPNTVLVEFPESRHHGVEMKVTVPGPGTVRIKEIGVATRGRVQWVPGLRSRELRATACGPISAPLPGGRPLQRLLEKRGQIRLVMNVTFTPRGGKPFQQRAAVRLVPG